MGLVEDLSAAFVAFTAEVDDAAEARVAHSTTRGGRGGGPWLVSLAMWENCLRWLPEDGLSVAELIATARTPTNFAGMRRWGYIEIEGMGRGTKGPPKQDAVVRLRKRGVREQRLWEPLPAEIEGRWAERFGDEFRELRAALIALVEALEPGLPDTMPIVRHGWLTRREEDPKRRPGPIAIADLGLDSLLARPLTALALEYEASGRLSLALSTNLLAALGREPTPLRDLPDATGIQREQIDNAVGYLERASLAEVVPTPGAKRGKSVALTARGEEARAATDRKLSGLEAKWEERHGESLARVRDALSPLSGQLAVIEHPPGTWRAESKPLARLPRFPLVTHRGGFPDGA
jgi:DNA-binding MarR family transcriptional regulator